MRPPAERTPPRRLQTPGEKAFGIKPSTPKRAPSPKAPKSDRSQRRPSQSLDEGAGSADVSGAVVPAPARASSPVKAKRSSSPKRKARAKSQRSARPPATSAIQQPEWDWRGPPKRAPGEVVNKYNHRGALGITGSLTSGGGFDMEKSGQWEGESVAETTTTRPDRITNSPTGKFHPNPERRNDLRSTDMFTNINYFSPGGAPDNDRKMKESSWVSSQAWFESLRYYPKGKEAIENEDCEVTFSGNTHGSTVPAEHIQNDVRAPTPCSRGRRSCCRSHPTPRQERLTGRGP